MESQYQYHIWRGPYRDAESAIGPLSDRGWDVQAIIPDANEADCLVLLRRPRLVRVASVPPRQGPGEGPNSQ